MAGDKDTTNYIIRGVPSTIQPVCSSGLTFVWDSSNNYWYYNHESTTTFPLTISATGYVSQTITTSTSSGGYYWIDITLKPENLYAWTATIGNNTTTFYTNTENPSTSSHIYDSNGNDVTNTYIYSGDTGASFTSASSSSMTYDVYWGTFSQTYTATLPIGYNYSE